VNVFINLRPHVAVRGDLGIKIVLENVQVATHRTADRAARRPRRKKNSSTITTSGVLRSS
jgi:pyruvate kinase